MTPPRVSQCAQLLPGCFSPGKPVVRPFVGPRRLLASALLAAVCGGSAFAQSAPATTAENPDKTPVLELDKLTVTGSNIRMTAADADKGALPVEIISNSRFQLTSSESVADFMRTMPAITGTMTTVGNIENSNQGQNLNLRGLGANYTLVLVDGRRFAGEGSNADVSSIPADAIESIEILKGGSSAIYGTDAVAGVINIKLKHNYVGADAVASYGNTTNKDAGVQRYALSFGQKYDKLSVTGTVEYQKHNSIFRFDRGVTASRNWVYLGGNDKRNGTYTTVQRILGLPGAAAAGLIIDTAKFTPGQTSLDPASYVQVQPDQRLTTSEPEAWPAFHLSAVTWGVNYQLLDKRAVVFADGFYQQQSTRFQFQPPTARVNVAANNPYNPFGLPVTVVYSFGPRERNFSRPALDINDKNALNNVFGVKGDVGQFSYEVAYSRFHLQNTQTEQDDIDQTKAQAAVNNGAFNPFGYWANSPDLINALYMNSRQLEQNENLDVISAKLTGTIFELPAGPLRFALGAENRKADWKIRFDEGWRTTATLWHPPSAANVDAKRHRSIDAYFGELSVPVWRAKQSGAFLGAVDISGAERKESYSKTQDVTIPQGSLRVALLDESIVLRGSYSESFRAPSLSNLTTPVVTTLNTISTVFDPVRGAALPFNLTTGGNPNLRPESGKNYDIGAIYTPKGLPALTLKADYYDIKIEDVIVTPSIIDVMNGTSPVGSITRDANLFPTLNVTVSNAGVIQQTGYDLGATYRIKSDRLGNFTFDLNGTYITKYQSVFGATTTQYLGKLSTVYGAIPKIRTVFGTLWDYNRWQAAGFLHYMSGITEPILSTTRSVEHYTTGDIQLSYNFKDSARWGGALKGTKVTLGVENIWDEALPFIDSLSEGWDRTNADYRGRYVYIELRKKF